MTLLYLAIAIYMIGYLIYSWYWQVMIDYRARFRVSSVIWALLFVILGFSLDYFVNSSMAIHAFIAAFIVMGIVDGFSGFSPKRLVVSGYFKRTLKYSDVERVTLIQVPTARKPTVLAIFQTKNRQAYYMRFSKKLEDVIVTLRKYLGSGVGIEIRQVL